MYSGVVHVDDRPDRSSSPTEVRPSLTSLYHKNVLLRLMALYPKAFCSIWWDSAAVFFKTETKFDEILYSVISVLKNRRITKT
jgi:hypothetical protein